MAFRLAFLFSIVFALAVAADIREKAGTKPLGEVCTSPMECLEPLYCLKEGDGYACGKKPCRGEGECRIGQFCGQLGVCEVKTCSKDDDCAGDTVCQVNEKCGAKSTAGQTCASDSQCWSKKCTDGKCEAGSANTEDEDGNIISDNPLTDNPVSNTARRLLGGGAIAGLIVGILTLLAVCCLLGFCYKKFFKKKNETSAQV